MLGRIFIWVVIDRTIMEVVMKMPSEGALEEYEIAPVPKKETLVMTNEEICAYLSDRGFDGTSAKVSEIGLTGSDNNVGVDNRTARTLFQFFIRLI